MGIETKRRELKDIVVPYDIAKQLVEVGFDVLSPFHYNGSGRIKANIVHSSEDAFIEVDNYIGKETIPAPLWTDVIDWFREVHNHYHPIYIWKHRDKPTLYSHITGERTESYQEANKNRILHLIETLKEKQNVYIQD